MDFVKDNNPKHLDYVKDILGELPSYVKEASLHERSEAITKLNDSAFADTSNREFPVDTKENTYLSYAYAKSAGLDDSKILSKIAKAIKLHGITEDTYGVDSAMSEMTKKASSDDISDQFALSIDYGGDTGVKYYYPVTDEYNITKSARELSEDFEKMPVEAFRHAAKNLIKAARTNELDIAGLPDRIKKNGIDREFNYEGAKVAAKQREEKLGQSAGEVYFEIVKSAGVDSENAEDYANLFIDMDRINNIKYSSTLLNPFEAFFSGYDKEDILKVANTYVVVSEAPIPMSEFTKKARSVIEKNFVAEDRDNLLGIVKEAEENGGISASEKLLEFPTNLQKQFLGELIND